MHDNESHLDRLRRATEQLHDALSVIEEYGGSIEYDGEIKQAAMSFGIDFTISHVEMVARLGSQRNSVIFALQCFARRAPAALQADMHVYLEAAGYSLQPDHSLIGN